MDTIDRSHSNLPAHLSPQMSPLPPLVPALPFEQAGAPTINFGPKVIARGLTRYWKWILPAWLVLSIPTVLLIYKYKDEPNYEASSLLEIETQRQDLYAPAFQDGEDRSTKYLQTQVTLIKTKSVLEAALASPAVKPLAAIKKWEDPWYDLRNKLKVWVLGDTNLIRVALDLPNKDEAITIVKQVVEEYTKMTSEVDRFANRVKTESYEKHIAKIHSDIETKRDGLKKLVSKGNFKFDAGDLLNTNSATDTGQRTFKSLPAEHLQRMISEVYQTDLDLAEAKSLLEAKEAANIHANEEASERQASASDGTLLARIEDEFRKDPIVLGLLGDIEKIEDRIDHNKRVVRQANDPSTQAAVKHLDKLKDKYQVLWKDKYKEIRQRLRVAAGTTHSLASIEELRLKIELLASRKERQTSLLKDMEFKQRGSNEDTFDASYLNYQLNSLIHLEELVRKNLEQVRNEAARDVLTVRVKEEASAARAPASSKDLVRDAGIISLAGDQGPARRRSRRASDPGPIGGLWPTPVAQQAVGSQAERAGCQRSDRAIHPATRSSAVRRVWQ